MMNMMPWNIMKPDHRIIHLLLSLWIIHIFPKGLHNGVVIIDDLMILYACLFPLYQTMTWAIIIHLHAHNIDNITIDSSAIPSEHDTTSRTSSKAEESIYSEDQSSTPSDHLTKPQQFLSSPTMSYLKRKQQRKKPQRKHNFKLSCIDLLEQMEQNCGYYNAITSRSLDDDEDGFDSFWDVVYNYIYSKN